MAGDGSPGRWAPEVLRDVGEGDEDFGYCVGVRESTDPDAWSLQLMEPYDMDDEQEIASGMDTYCLVVDPGQATCYGGVLECELADSHLRMVLNESAARELGTPAEMTFSLMLTPDQIQALRRGLRRVLTMAAPTRCRVTSLSNAATGRPAVRSAAHAAPPNCQRKSYAWPT